MTLDAERYFPSELAVIRQVPKDIVFFDVGAHSGEICRIALDHGITRIHAFEPQPACHDALRQLPITVVTCAVGPERGTVALYSAVYDDQTPDYLLSMRRRNLDHQSIDHGARVITAAMVTLDEYCSFHNVDRIGLLKIDVEGHEAAVLEGASRLLDERRIDLIMFEHVPEGWHFADGFDPAGLAQGVLEAHGYSVEGEGLMLLARPG